MSPGMGATIGARSKDDRGPEIGPLVISGQRIAVGCSPARCPAVRPACVLAVFWARAYAYGYGLWLLHPGTPLSGITKPFTALSAAGVGFEPTIEVAPDAGFQDRCVQPLRHPALLYGGEPSPVSGAWLAAVASP